VTEVVVTAGATGALGSCILALIDKGDELVLFEPTFPMYLDHLEVAQGVLKSVPLETDENGNWVFDPKKLRSAFSAKTKLLVINTPHNPTGKAFT